MLSTTEVIARIRAGEAAAWAELFEGQVPKGLAYASRYLKSRELAEDAVQEACLDVYRHLEALRDPAAFSGWFRKIVRKHCDRLARRRALIAYGADPDAYAAAERDSPESGSEWLTTAVATLPQDERAIVSSHYFGDLPLAEVAAQRGESLSLVKKRLAAARGRLQPFMEGVMKDGSKETLLPSRVLFYIAVSSGDVAQARHLLEREKHLLADQAPDDQLLAPWRAGDVPLVWAVASGSAEMLELLLSHGADPHATSATSKETALHVAAARGLAAAVERLLKAGADPNARAANGMTPLHHAEARGQAEVGAKLRAAGADPTIANRHGLTPDDWTRRRKPLPVLETGIRAIDLFAPIPPGGSLSLYGTTGTGKLVLLLELIHNFHEMYGTKTLMFAKAGAPPLDDVPEREAKDSGLAGALTVHRELPAKLARATAPTLLFIDRRFFGKTALKALLAGAGSQYVPVYLRIESEPWDGKDDGCDARVVTSAELAERGIWPAIDPAASTSRLLAGDSAQAELIGKLRATGRAAMCVPQPFAVAELHTGIPGERVSRAAAIASATAAAINNVV